MENIDIKTINFAKLRQIKSNSLEAKIYHDEKWAYKIYKKIPGNIRERKSAKIELLHDGDCLPNVIMPEAKIIRGKRLEGHKMRYVADSENLADFIAENNNLGEFLRLIKNISADMRTIHRDPRGIVMADLNFENILINEDGHHFGDLDNWEINGIRAEMVSSLFNYYLRINNLKLNYLDPLTDRLSLMLSFLSVLFSTPIKPLSMREFDEKSEKIRSLKNIRDVVRKITGDIDHLSDVPYLDDIILEEDTKQTSLIF